MQTNAFASTGPPAYTGTIGPRFVVIVNPSGGLQVKGGGRGGAESPAKTLVPLKRESPH